ncbi:hypothetical protein [Cryptosporangium minutisporangium]|uniref:Major facilitator superfamily (MFS) profile domain-containing protein n=1 Tax=Cryptosporangium minutisporangium TaxID=113569 RepID=A0ABP6SQR4_9ACTN
MLLNLGGIFGTAALGLLAARIALQRVLIAYLIATAVFLAAFIASTLALGGVVGVLVNGCVAGLYALTSASYQAEVRTTGMGTGLAFGRVGAVLTPTLAGAFLDAGATPEQLYVAAGVVFALAAVAVASLRRRTVAPIPAPAVS